MAKFLGFDDLAIAKTSLQQSATELNSSASICFFLREIGSRLSFRVLMTTLSTPSIHEKLATILLTLSSSAKVTAAPLIELTLIKEVYELCLRT